MTAKKGTWGGARPNTGGPRPGAGRKPKASKSLTAKEPATAAGRTKKAAAVEVKLEAQPTGGALKRSKSRPVEQDPQDMLTLLQNIALGRTDATAIQVKAAVAAVQYTHAKKGEGGKKDERQKAAEKVGGRFAPTAPPRARMN